MKKQAAAGKSARASSGRIRRTPTVPRKSTNRYTSTAPEQPYALREPTTGLYAVLGDPACKPAARLGYQANATRFASANDALIAARAAGVADQPHEIVRIDA